MSYKKIFHDMIWDSYSKQFEISKTIDIFLLRWLIKISCAIDKCFKLNVNMGFLSTLVCVKVPLISEIGIHFACIK